MPPLQFTALFIVFYSVILDNPLFAPPPLGKSLATGLDSASVIKSTNLDRLSEGYIRGSRSTFEFTGLVNLSGPSLYCIARTKGLIKQTLNRTSRCNKVDAVRLYASYRSNLHLPKGQRCVTCVA